MEPSGVFFDACAAFHDERVHVRVRGRRRWRWRAAQVRQEHRASAHGRLCRCAEARATRPDVDWTHTCDVHVPKRSEGVACSHVQTRAATMRHGDVGRNVVVRVAQRKVGSVPRQEDEGRPARDLQCARVVVIATELVRAMQWQACARRLFRWCRCANVIKVGNDDAITIQAAFSNSTRLWTGSA